MSVWQRAPVQAGESRVGVQRFRSTPLPATTGTLVFIHISHCSRDLDGIHATYLDFDPWVEGDATWTYVAVSEVYNSDTGTRTRAATYLAVAWTPTIGATTAGPTAADPARTLISVSSCIESPGEPVTGSSVAVDTYTPTSHEVPATNGLTTLPQILLVSGANFGASASISVTGDWGSVWDDYLGGFTYGTTVVAKSYAVVRIRNSAAGAITTGLEGGGGMDAFINLSTVDFS